jgi:hypothetical protein
MDPTPFTRPMLGFDGSGVRLALKGSFKQVARQTVFRESSCALVGALVQDRPLRKFRCHHKGVRTGDGCCARRYSRVLEGWLNHHPHYKYSYLVGLAESCFAT